MKKAVITTGGKQYIVSEGEELEVELLNSDSKKAEFDALLVYGEDKVNIGKPLVSGAKVLADILESEVQQQKVTSIRYKAKKRVHKLKGHRQVKTRIKVQKIQG